jgi:hypothetical protein
VNAAGWLGWGGLLFFLPLLLMMAVALLALWLFGRWSGREDRPPMLELYLLVVIGAAAALAAALLLWLWELL